MRLVTFQRRQRGERAGLWLDGNRIVDIGLAYSRLYVSPPGQADDTAGLIDALRGVSGSLLHILEAGDEALDMVRRIEKSALQGELDACIYEAADCQVRAPLSSPPLLCMAQSYPTHAQRPLQSGSAEAASSELPDAWYSYPTLHYLNPTVLAGAGESAWLNVDYMPEVQIQLACVLRREVDRADVDDAREAILGYLACAVLAENGWPHLAGTSPLGRPPIVSRIVCGPYIQVGRGRGLPSALSIVANGAPQEVELRKDRHFSLAEAVAFASHFSPIPAGAIFLSGGLPISQPIKLGEENTIGVQGGPLGDFELRCRLRLSPAPPVRERTPLNT